MEAKPDRAWAPHERNYSGGRFGVWHDDEWTMLRVEAGIADATASITKGEAADLAKRLSPALVERLDYLFAEMKKAQNALHQFTWADTLSPLLRKIAEDWDCDSSQCEFASGDMGGLSCPCMDDERGCRAVEADELRQFADALEVAAALRARAASVDTHPKNGDVQQAPLVSGAVGEAETPNG